jgi:hypothetical protein
VIPKELREGAKVLGEHIRMLLDHVQPLMQQGRVMECITALQGAMNGLAYLQELRWSHDDEDDAPTLTEAEHQAIDAFVRSTLPPSNIPISEALLHELSYHAKESARRSAQEGREIGTLIAVNPDGEPLRAWYITGDAHAVNLPLPEAISKLHSVDAAAAIVHHTHLEADGQCQPSDGDLVALKKIANAFTEGGIQLLDFTISGPPDRGWCAGYSARESGDLIPTAINPSPRRPSERTQEATSTPTDPHALPFIETEWDRRQRELEARQRLGYKF